MLNLLIIEDDPAISRVLDLELTHEGYNTTLANDGKIGLLLTEENKYDLILLDLMLPNLNGKELCRRVRSGNGNSKNTPIIMLTARDSTMDIVSGLDQGANEYMVKPFEIEELLARIRVQLRSNDKSSNIPEILVFKDLTLDSTKRQFWKGDKEVVLTKTEFDLIEYLLKNESIVISKEKLLKNVWHMSYWDNTNLVEVYIGYLRNKIENDSKLKYIKTVRGVGYVIRD